MTSKPFLLWLSALLLLALAAAAALSLGRFYVPPAEIWHSLLQQHADENYNNVVFNLRLPRVLAAVLVGAALAGAGAAFQGIFRNPLVSPDLLGVSGGACVGAAAAVLLGWGMAGMQAAAFCGGLAAVLAAMQLPRLVGNDSTLVLVLAGIVVSGFAAACLGLLKYLADPESQLAEIVYWQLGSLGKAHFGSLAAPAPLMVLSAAALLALRWRVNILSLGEREARSAGADVRTERTLMVVLATFLTASAVCISGTIGWLGLVVPHLARLFAGDNNLRALPLSMLGGAVFLLLADTLARNISVQEIPLGIITGFIGAPFFAWVLVRQKAGR